MNKQIKIDLDWIIKYPFTEEAREYIRVNVPPLEEFTEDELIVLCDALTLAEANAKRQLLNIQLQKDALCPTTTTVSTSGTSGTA